MVAHSELLLSKCAQFREQREFIDVRLKVGEEEFPAHRIVLAANSDYFHAMFVHGMKESKQEVIELKDKTISATTLKIVMDSIYSGKLDVNDENVFEVLLTADHLQVKSVVEQCCNYLQTTFDQQEFDVQTYCRICTIADEHRLNDLQEATERKMAFMYKEMCEKEEFLSHMSADNLSNLLRRDDLSAPTENFVFKSVMQWINYKKEERMAVAAKVIGAVRLGLVDIKDMIRELNTEEMRQLPEVNSLLHESLLYSHIPSSSSFGEEKTKLRSSGTALFAVAPQTQMQWFDAESKSWKLFASLALATKVTSYLCAEAVGSKLFVFGSSNVFHCYDIEGDAWIDKTASCAVVCTNNVCTVGDYMYAFPSDCNQVPQRYSLTEDRWQSFAKVNIRNQMYQQWYSICGATVLNSKVYILYGHRSWQRNDFPAHSYWVMQNAALYWFNLTSNIWEEKSLTCSSHFGSTLFVVNAKMYVAGGCLSLNDHFQPCGEPAPVEVYNEEKNTWSVVEQKHIPSNNLGALEIEGRVYFIINKFPFDSGIRIPPGEVYPVSLDDWKNLRQISEKAVLCYLPLKNRDLKPE